MTDELTKTFFDTFGIEPKYESHSCDGWGRTVEVKNFTDKKEADKFGIVVSELEYPQITDTHYLKLICILNKFDTEFIYFYQEDINVLKETILEDCLEMVCKLRQDKFEQLKHQVRTLFEEG